MAEERLRLAPSSSRVPLADAEFAARMAALGPFESRPLIAIAVSGGADSLALTLLMHEWARARGGRVVGLTVDHGLRPGSTAEAASVRDRLRDFGIEHETLTWRGRKPSAGIQAAARAVRYALMEEYCREAGILHLALGHHADDQAETMLLRLARGSGPDGLAAMAPVRETAAVRLIRPLLDVSKARLVAYLDARRVGWIEDPSNADPRFARSALRERPAAESAAAGFVVASARFARARVALERETARWLARHVSLSPLGFARLDRAGIWDTPEEIVIRGLSRLATAIGGKDYPPAVAAVEGVASALFGDGRGRTLAGCRFDPAGTDILICREARNLPAALDLSPGDRLTWDGRFEIAAGPMAAGARLRPLGDAGWRRLSSDGYAGPLVRMPHPVRLTLPAVEAAAGIFPLLPSAPEETGYTVRFRPKIPIAGVGFTIA